MSDPRELDGCDDLRDVGHVIIDVEDGVLPRMYKFYVLCPVCLEMKSKQHLKMAHNPEHIEKTKRGFKHRKVGNKWVKK